MKSIPIKVIQFASGHYTGLGLHGTGSVESSDAHKLTWYPQLACFEIKFQPPGAKVPQFELVAQAACSKWVLEDGRGIEDFRGPVQKRK